MKDPLSIQHDYARRATRSMAVIRDYLAGVPLVDMVNRYQLASGSILRIVRLAGCPKRRPGNSQETREAVCAAYRDGVPLAEIRERHSIDRKTIWTIVKKANVPLRKSSHSSSER